MRRLLRAAGVAVLLFAAVLSVQALRLRSRQVAAAPVPALVFDRGAAVERFAQALRFRTVSTGDPGDFAAAAFADFQRFLEEQFPKVHASLRRETSADHSLIYTWPGADPSLKPGVLLAHQDVVPVEPGTESTWTHPPFEGHVAEGFVWGRGAMDDKVGLMASLQAAEILLEQGFQPRRTFLLAFGHDEEVGGHQGAQRVAVELLKRGVAAEYVLDEGGSVVSAAVPGVKGRMALIGTAEKGSVTLALEVRAPGGHSSTPPEHTAIGIVSRAVERLEDQQMPMRLCGPVRQMIDHVAPELPFLARVPLANLWLFQPLLYRAAASVPALAASLRTTTAVTMVEGGVKENVLPSSARAVVNFRILPGDTIASVTAHAREVVADDRVQIQAIGDGGREPSPESPTDTPAFATLERVIRAVFPNVLVTPYLDLGGTDARHYVILTPNVYRFMPIVADASDLNRVHGTDERLSVENYGLAVQFFARLYQDS